MNQNLYEQFHYMFPFHLIPRGADIILYGMGKCGRDYVAQIGATEYCNILYAIDEKALESGMTGLKVIRPDGFHVNTVEENHFAVVALAELDAIRKVTKQLKEKGFDSARIVSYRMRVVSDIQKPILDYLGALREEIKVYETACRGLVRVGRDYDGGYIMLDDFGKGCIAYSFGVAEDDSWEAAMASRGYEVFMYDPSVDRAPSYNERFHFKKRGISGAKSQDGLFDTIDSFLNENKHFSDAHMILKMDVEGAEWGFIDQSSAQLLKRFDQITMELHGLLYGENKEQILRCLRKLNSTHSIIHVHANNITIPICVEGAVLSDLLEITWVSKEQYESVELASRILPIDIDMPNIKECADVPLGRL